MSYDGEYDEYDTCSCGRYWRSCSLHGPTGQDPWPTSKDNTANSSGEETR